MKNIAVISSGIIVNHASRMITGIKKCINEQDANAFVFTCSRRYEKNMEHDIGEYNIYTLPDFEQFDGVILINSTVGSDEVLETLATKIEKAHIPAVGIERKDSNMFNVYINNKLAMKEIVSHFVKVHGFTRLNYISGPLSNEEAVDRLEAYLEVLCENDIPIEQERIYYKGTFLKNSGMEATEYFLNSKLPLPQAIISANDVMILGACEVLTNHGIRVPEDIALSGFDDDFDAKCHVPAITSVARRQEEVGYTACKKLLSGMTEENRGKCLEVKTEAIFRESCGCNNNTQLDNVGFRKMHFEQKKNDEKYVDITKSMSVDLTSVESFEQLKKYLRQYIPKMECEEMYFFLCDDFSNEDDKLNLYKESTKTEDYLREGYGDTTKLLVGFDGDCYREDEDIDFAGLLQLIKDSKKKHLLYTVSPIHFRDRCFGYCVIGNDTFSTENHMFYTWLMNIGNAIETIRKQMLMRTMISKLDLVWSYDALTGVYNRSGFRKYGRKVWEEAEAQNSNVMILFMDLDGLKIVNDTYGHEEGDRFIKTFAMILKENKHPYDAIMRYGGDEFVIIAICADEKYAKDYIDMFIKEMNIFNSTSNWKYKLGASIGYYIANPNAGEILEEAIEEADRRMYENKKRKKEIRGM
ncbi:MAG: GGDEF domain-containing protein [Lachnospiraceae bacterium]|nr:GGDEF domain-containing protein [Lachnospiraceae bacterium]